MLCSPGGIALCSPECSWGRPSVLPVGLMAQHVPTSWQFSKGAHVPPRLLHWDIRRAWQSSRLVSEHTFWKGGLGIIIWVQKNPDLTKVKVGSNKFLLLRYRV